MSYLMKLPLAIRFRVSRKWVALFFGLWAMVTPAFAQYNEPLYCQPNEGNTFTIKSGGTFSIDSDCGTSTIVTNPTHGTLTLSGYQTWVYTATNGYLGSDVFTVHVSTSVGSPGGQGNFNEGGGNETITLNITQSAPRHRKRDRDNALQHREDDRSHLVDHREQHHPRSTSTEHPATAPQRSAADVLTYTPTSTFYGGTDQFYYTATNSGGNLIAGAGDDHRRGATGTDGECFDHEHRLQHGEGDQPLRQHHRGGHHRDRHRHRAPRTGPRWSAVKRSPTHPPPPSTAAWTRLRIPQSIPAERPHPQRSRSPSRLLLLPPLWLPLPRRR